MCLARHAPHAHKALYAYRMSSMTLYAYVDEKCFIIVSIHTNQCICVCCIASQHKRPTQEAPSALEKDHCIGLSCGACGQQCFRIAGNYIEREADVLVPPPPPIRILCVTADAVLHPDDSRRQLGRPGCGLHHAHAKMPNAQRPNDSVTQH